MVSIGLLKEKSENKKKRLTVADSKSDSRLPKAVLSSEIFDTARRLSWSSWKIRGKLLFHGNTWLCCIPNQLVSLRLPSITFSVSSLAVHYYLQAEASRYQRCCSRTYIASVTHTGIKTNTPFTVFFYFPFFCSYSFIAVFLFFFFLITTLLLFLF